MIHRVARGIELHDPGAILILDHDGRGSPHAQGRTAGRVAQREGERQLAGHLAVRKDRDDNVFRRFAGLEGGGPGDGGVVDSGAGAVTAGAVHGEALLGEVLGEGVADERLVIDDEDAGGR